MALRRKPDTSAATPKRGRREDREPRLDADEDVLDADDGESDDDVEDELEADVEDRDEEPADAEIVAEELDAEVEVDIEEGEELEGADEPDIEPEEVLDEEPAVVKPPVLVRPIGRPSPGRPPSAKDEPEPPFNIGERIRLVQNTRPRTGTPIGDHPVGAIGRVETVLSQTAIVRFDRAPDLKEVVAFVCLESLDEAAKAARAVRERERAAQEASKG